jgi:cyclophilin family peptidyl-prolyl cis-trans isomerase
VRLTTEQGDIVIGLFTESSPVAAENFLALARSGFYDGTTFHRLVPGFVIQGGDPSGDGTGGPGYTIPDEPVVGRYGRGIVAMARTPEPDSQGSQFFIVLDDEAEGALQSARTYAIFGRVVEGMDVVDAIAAMPNSGEPDNRALEPVAITGAAIEQVQLPPDEPPSPAGPVGDPKLEARFPTSLGGQPLPVESYTGPEVAQLAGPDSPTVIQLRDALVDLGLTLDDLSVAFAGVTGADGGSLASITALRVAGIDESTLLGTIAPIALGLADMRQQAAELAGKPVVIITDGPDDGVNRGYGYLHDDTLWLVFAQEPLLSEAIGALP